MDRLLNSIDIAEAIGCSRDQALILMRKMRHIDVSSSPTRCNLRVWEKDFRNWLDGRTAQPMPKRKPGRRPKKTGEPKQPQLIPYVHD